ncbi:response regulator [Ramlibacter sp. USB13]|uniref:Response regulator n=1 Tax=Ramlibacter cellulosilyticus TaxID=2764187 RepID=A0A923S988_9BURK|nr:response regulator [Ramlibacter cellulosilyticus]
MTETKARVVLVEDSPRIQAELREALGMVFDVVAVIATAQEAVEWLQAHPRGWDLAVVDIFLKQGHGFQVLRHCAPQAHQSVVVLSNYTREPARSSALEQGASAVFDKGLEMEQFLAYCAARAEVHARHQARAAAAEAKASLPRRMPVARSSGMLHEAA